ncbi:MAG: hypothetical protein HUJ51_03050 [Eggerthellaceae bacterium]|nr:hypothetical protein [Eggerthellaceae bacterium]
MILRLVVGVEFYSALSSLFNAILPSSLLGTDFMMPYILVTLRFFILTFAIFGLYPLVFRSKPFK